jgi:hypothetical protein
MVTKARHWFFKLLVIQCNLHCFSLRVLGGCNLIQQFRTVFHCADERAANGHETSSNSTLQVLRCTHVDQPGGDRAGRQAVLHEHDKHCIRDAHVDAAWFSAQNLHQHDLCEGFLTQQIVHQVGVSVVQAGQCV